MKPSSSEILWISYGIATSVAFVIGLMEKNKVDAYYKAMALGTLVIFLPSCIPMFSSVPVEAGQAVEEVFWRWPLYLLWFAIGPIAIAYARVIKGGGNS